MKLDTRSKYAIEAIVEIAKNQQNRPVTLAELAQKQDISVSYLEQIFAQLRKAGIVESIRGPGGGYLLASDGAEVTVADIIRSLDPGLGKFDKKYKGNNRHVQLEQFWDALHLHVVDFFEHVTLKQVLAGKF